MYNTYTSPALYHIIHPVADFRLFEQYTVQAIDGSYRTVPNSDAKVLE